MDSFFDLPVYRLTQEHYMEKRADFIDRQLFQRGSPIEAQLRALAKKKPGTNAFMEQHLGNLFGGDWQFNEIIGHIRLHFVGTQVRGEWYVSNAKRHVRTRTKTLEWRTHKLAPEVEIKRPYGNKQIRAAILRYIKDCQDELPGRFVDTSVLDTLLPHIDFKPILDAS